MADTIRRSTVLDIMQTAGDRGVTSSEVARVLFSREGSKRERKQIVCALCKLVTDGTARTQKQRQRHGQEKRYWSTFATPPPPTDALTAIREQITGAGDEGLRVSQIADRTGVPAKTVCRLIRDAASRGEMVPTPSSDAASAGRSWRIVSPRVAQQPQSEARIVSRGKTPAELMPYLDSLRKRGFAPVVPTEAERVLVGRLDLSHADAVALAQRRISVADLMGLS